MGVSQIVKPVTAPRAATVDLMYDADPAAAAHRRRLRSVRLPRNVFADTGGQRWLLEETLEGA